MNLASFKISIQEVGQTLKEFSLLRMRGVKSLNDDGLSQEFKSASIKEDYGKAYSIGLKNFDFDFLLLDQSYFQFELKESNSYVDIRYAFYQNPINYISYSEYVQEQLKELNLYEMKDDVGSLLEDEYNQYLNEQEMKTNYTTIRYDSDFNTYKPLVHSVSHLHIGHSNNLRIPINKLLSPLSFTLFAIKHVYYLEWKEKVDNNSQFIEERLSTCKTGEQNLPPDFWTTKETLELFLR